MAAPGIKVVTGSIAAGGSGTKTAFTSSGFGTPDFALVLVSEAYTTSNPEAGGLISVGIWDGSTDGFGATWGDNYRRTNDNALYFSASNLDIIKAEATTDGINLWNAGSTSVARHAVVVLVSGVTGADLRYVSNVQGGITLSGLSIDPNFVLAIGMGHTALDAVLTAGIASVGMAAWDGTTITQGCVMYDADNTNGRIVADKIAGQYFNGTLTWEEDVSAFGASSITFGDGTGGSGDGLICLILQLANDGDGHVAVIDAKGSTGTQAYTGFGFTPVGAFFVPTSNTATGSDTNFAGLFLGADDGTTKGAVTLAREPGGGTDESEFTASYSLFATVGGAPFTEAYVNSFDSDGFTLQFDTSNSLTKILVGAFGDSAGGGPATITGTGALVAGAATVAGTAERELTATGALSAQAAAIAGTGTASGVVTGTGALAAQAATIAGTAERELTATGALSAQMAAIAGTAEREITGTGAPAADAAAVSGTGTVTSTGVHTGTGVLAAQSATMTGAGILARDGTGALAAGVASINATGIIARSASGALASQTAAIAGTGVVATPGTVTGTGAIAVSAATISGTGVVTTPDGWTPVAPAGGTWATVAQSTGIWTEV